MWCASEDGQRLLNNQSHGLHIIPLLRSDVDLLLARLLASVEFVSSTVDEKLRRCKLLGCERGVAWHLKRIFRFNRSRIFVSMAASRARCLWHMRDKSRIRAWKWSGSSLRFFAVQRLAELWRRLLPQLQRFSQAKLRSSQQPQRLTLHSETFSRR